MDNPLVSNAAQVLLPFLGKELKSVVGNFYRRNGVVGKLPLSIQFTFDNETDFFRVFCSSDGESIGVDVNPLEVFSMQEDGEVFVSLLPPENFQFVYDALGYRLCAESLVMLNTVCIGIWLEMSSRQICIINNGDEIFLSTEIPAFIADAEKLVLK